MSKLAFLVYGVFAVVLMAALLVVPFLLNIVTINQVTSTFGNTMGFFLAVIAIWIIGILLAGATFAIGRKALGS